MTSSDDVPDPRQGPLAALRWLYRTDHGLVAFCREAASGVLAVALVALLLFGVTGVWPPVAAIESGSMEPHLHPGDAVIVAEPDRFGPAGVHDTGVVTYQRGQETGYTSVGAPGDVIVYYPNGEWKTPVIHRARFWVEEGENWYDEANQRFLRADSCAELTNCPAPNSGFITKGDANPGYDQAAGFTRPVEPAWIQGTVTAKVPFLGTLRSTLTGEYHTGNHSGSGHNTTATTATH
ncbi:S26 family signal peptidase [Halospeciosus flavus]|uniref:S26 family signal peptidase n=1 Tax=Halospeciosus flavus TaxID=3032283 RepID=A0ABD5Z3Y3_9EURY|nr:S26 family signal peptidase [Halospeciosus flavus]